MKILIIDDDDGLRKSVSLILTDADYEVVLAEDGESGLSTAYAARRWARVPSVVPRGRR